MLVALEVNLHVATSGFQDVHVVVEHGVQALACHCAPAIETHDAVAYVTGVLH